MMHSLAPVYFLLTVFVATVLGGGNIICPLKSRGRGGVKVGCRLYILKERGQGFSTESQMGR